ncbi:hypothetical protein OHD50_20190 [Escherichia coli]|nr:hypothetical protein [Escherichia coli]
MIKYAEERAQALEGKNKLAELEYIKDTVVILLEDIPSHSDWKK